MRVCNMLGRRLSIVALQEWRACLAAFSSLDQRARFVRRSMSRFPSSGCFPICRAPDYEWRGFDPTHGIAVTDGHVALCAAPDQAATMPIEGGFYGNGVTATLDCRVRIATPRCLPSDWPAKEIKWKENNFP